MSGGMQTSRGGNGASGVTNLTANTTGSVQTITLTQPSTQITIINQGTGTNVLSIDFNGGTPVIGVGNGVDIPAAGSFTWDGVALTGFTMLGSAAAIQYCLVAH
jgi:hypothetical protein